MTSEVTFIASEISKGVLGNASIYPRYGKHSDGIPMDEDQKDQMDLQNRKYELAIGEKHFLALIGPTPQRILDLDTGIGIWALDVGDMFPLAECFNHFKPCGWCELAFIYPVPMRDDGSIPETSGFKTVCAKFMEAGKIFGTPPDTPLYFATYLREAGVIDISETIFKVPASPWRKDKNLKIEGAGHLDLEVSTKFSDGQRNT